MITSKFKKIIIGFSLILVAVLSMFNTATSFNAYAAENKSYSFVLDDLKKDSSFLESYYPEKSDDYSLQVIQLAESIDNELFVYVYQPSGQKKNLNACSINISTTINDDISFYNYKLELCNSSGTLFKYVVKNFAVQSVPTRYYAISSIYRPFDSTIDKDADYDNTITEVDSEVSKQYCFSIINGKAYVQVVDIETIVVTDKFVGFVRYKDGFKLFTSGACDSHFVAFNTDKPIDKLLEADVYYTYQSYSWTYTPYTQGFENFGEKLDGYAYPKYMQKVEHTGDGLFAGTYKWDRIETVEQFIKENDLTQNVYSGVLLDVNVGNEITEEGKKALKGKKWVLRFLETSYVQRNNPGAPGYDCTLVGDVTILRLKFETDGVTYNLGVLDNKQTGSKDPINSETTYISLNPDLFDPFQRILAIIALILFVVLIVVFLPVLMPIFKAIFWLITLPFKAIGALFKRKKE